VFIILDVKLFDKRIDHIKYRNNVVTGEVATDNGNGTYDVYIAGSDVAYPNIPTTVREPDFGVGEAVEILIEYGNKEMPIIIGHAKKITQEFVEDKVNVLVTTLDAYSITYNSGYFEGRVEDIEGYENVIERGFHWGASTGYTETDLKSTGSFAAGSYSEQVTGLTAETTYHFQAYVYDADNDEHVGEDKTMTTMIAIGYIVVLSYNSDDSLYYLRLYDTSGDYLNKEVDSEGIFTAMWDLCMDANDNSYFIYSGGPYYAPYAHIKKYDEELNLIINYDVSDSEGMGVNGGNFASDGYLYTLDNDRSSPYHWFIHKRNTTTLAVLDTIVDLGAVNISGEPCFDTDGNFYLYYNTDDVVKKFNSSGTLIATSPSVPTMFARFGCGVIGDYVYFPKSATVLYYFPLDLSSVTEWTPTGYSHYGFTIKDGYFYWYNTNGILTKFDSDRNLVWSKDIGGSCREIGSYNF